MVSRDKKTISLYTSISNKLYKSNKEEIYNLFKEKTKCFGDVSIYITPCTYNSTCKYKFAVGFETPPFAIKQKEKVLGYIVKWIICNIKVLDQKKEATKLNYLISIYTNSK